MAKSKPMRQYLVQQPYFGNHLRPKKFSGGRWVKSDFFEIQKIDTEFDKKYMAPPCQIPHHDLY